MKKNHAIFILYLILTGSLSDSLAQSNEKMIEAIKTQFQLINKDSSLKKVRLENEEFLKDMTDGGGQLIGYFKSDTLLRIEEMVGLSYGIVQFEYYFNNEQLFFIYETQKSFPGNEAQGQINHTKLKLNYEGRYYLDKGKILDIKMKGIKRFDEVISVDYIHGLLLEANSYVQLLKSRRQQKRK